MSLYNLVHGENPHAEELLEMLNDVQYLDIPRYRDCYLSNDKTEIIVLTRTGGGNRQDYEEENEKMTMHPWYTHDEDADFDRTFAEFHFEIPENEE